MPPAPPSEDWGRSETSPLRCLQSLPLPPGHGHAVLRRCQFSRRKSQNQRRTHPAGRSYSARSPLPRRKPAVHRYTEPCRPLRRRRLHSCSHPPLSASRSVRRTPARWVTRQNTQSQVQYRVPDFP